MGYAAQVRAQEEYCMIKAPLQSYLTPTPAGQKYFYGTCLVHHPYFR
jgi:hypothetical protein